MAKKSKKRNKPYTGSNAAKLQPSITKVEAVNRSKSQQWWYENKKRVRPIAITAGVIILIIWLIIVLIQTFTR